MQNMGQQRSLYSDLLRNERSGIRMSMRVWFHGQIQTGPHAHSSFFEMGTVSLLPGKKPTWRGVKHSPLLALWLCMGTAISLPTLSTCLVHCGKCCGPILAFTYRMWDKVDKSINTRTQEKERDRK